MANIEEKVENLIKPKIEEIGYKLYDVQYVKEGKDYFLRIFIDKDSGIDLNDCEKVNDLVNPLLDEADYIKEQYFLEVSSPGIERVLRKDEHLNDAKGEEIEINLFKPLDGKKDYRGILKDYNIDVVTIENIENLHTENSNSMQYMFSQCRSLTSLDVSKFDTSSVTNMGSMFSGCSSLISLDVSKFDTSSVTNMGYMFFYCSSLTSLDVSKFDTSSVTNMEHMFSDCSNLVEINANNLDVSNVKNMSDLFSYCSKLETAKMNSWKAKEITDTNNMFRQCGKIKEINLSGFDTSKVTNMSRLFYLCNSLKK